MSTLQRIRQLVLDRRYYLSAHAEEEMWADELERPTLNAVFCEDALRNV